MEAKVKKTIKAPADKVWATIRSFDDVDTFIPAIATCSVEGNGVGAKRICTMQDGGKILERLERVDEEAKTLQYSISEAPLPVSDYLGTVKVRDLGNGTTEVEWLSTMEVKGMPEAELKAMLEGIYASGIEGLEKLHGAN